MKSKNKTFKKFLIVWGGQFLSAIGSGLTAFALGVFVFEKTQSATAYSLVILCSFLPSFFLLPFTGVLADRFDRKKMMMLGDAGSILGLVLILFIMLSGHIEIWHIYLGVGICSIFSAIQSPAYKAAVTDMVSEKQYSQASGLTQLAGSAQYLISPIVAGFLMNWFDIKAVLIIDILTFFIAITAVFVIQKQQETLKNNPQQKFFKDMSESFHYLISKRGVLLLILLTTIVCFYIGLLQTLIGPMMLTLADSHILGITLSLSASGMLVSSLFIGMAGLKKNKVLILSWSLVLAGLFYSLIGVFPAVIPIIIFGFLFFATLPFVNTILEVLIRENIENKQQGRVWSLVSAISQIGYILAFASAGFLADHIFNPLFLENGGLVNTVGHIIGIGPGRGIGLMFIISGIFVVILAVIIARIKPIRELEGKDVEALQ